MYVERRKAGDQVGSAAKVVTEPPPIDERLTRWVGLFRWEMALGQRLGDQLAGVRDAVKRDEAAHTRALR